MLRHESCGGELKRTGFGKYQYRGCRQRIYLGNPNRGQGVNLRSKDVRGIHTYYPIPKEGEDDMSLHSLIANGGKVLVVGGKMNPSWAEFTHHPQLVFWTGERKDIVKRLKNGNNFPDNTRGVLISRFIGHSEAKKVMEEARSKRALIMSTLNDGEITRKLEEITTIPKPEGFPPLSKSLPPPPPAPPPSPVVGRVPTGQLTKFIAEHHQAELITSQEGRRLFKLATEVGVKTTEMSCIASVKLYRHRMGIVIGKKAEGMAKRRLALTTSQLPSNPVPVSEAPIPPVTPVTQRSSPEPARALVHDTEENLIQMIDECISGLSLVREGIQKFMGKRGDYERLKAKLAALIND